MSTIKKKKEKRADLQTTLRAILLVLQILLPFGLYLGLQWNNHALTVLVAVLIGLSMVFLVWLG